MTELDRQAWRIRGVVQGVGFRYWAMREAQRLGVAGTVRNAADGSVEVAGAGSPAQLQELARLLAKGAPGSRVSSVEPLPAPSGELPEPFSIIR
jgi:acylphosphatase